jgi:uncharacterized membrane protein YhhN
MTRNTNIFNGLLIAVTIADLIFGFTGNELRLFTKPLLMPILMLLYYRSQPNNTVFARLIFAALFFSWLGDVSLMFEERDGIFFILGLSSFLTAHLLYIIYFSRIESNTVSFFRKRPIMFLAVVAYVIELLYLLWPRLGPMKIPVVVYALVIGTMLCFAMWQYGRVKEKTAFLFIIGAILFVLSDSALALNKFYQPHPWSGVFVMTTYVAAQALITLGSIAHLRERTS